MVSENLESEGYAESIEKCIKWVSVDENTFLKFWQFLYTGAYTADSPVIRTTRNTEAAHELSSHLSSFPKLNYDNMDAHPNDNHSLENGEQQKRLWNKFKDWPSSVGLSGLCKSMGNNSIHEDYTGTFLSHARLYIFAENHHITTLMDISLSELYKALYTFRLCNDRVNDIISLICYCYNNSTSEPLRELVTLYAASVASQLWVNKQFQALVHSHSKLAAAILELMMN